MRAIILLLICTPLLAIEQQGDAVALTSEDRETLVRCANEGGCKVWSKAEIVAMLLIFRQQLVESGMGCRRNSI